MKAKLLFLLLISIVSYGATTNFLFLKTNKQGQYAYFNSKGKAIIPFGKYDMCFTDTFKKFAIVLKHNAGFVAIDRNEQVVFNVFPFDNGPDYTVEGLLRIVKDGKIGYADPNFSIKIKPQFGCAFPFKNGIAKVSNDCKTVSYGEHQVWTSKHWFYINKAGIRVKN